MAEFVRIMENANSVAAPDTVRLRAARCSETVKTCAAIRVPNHGTENSDGHANTTSLANVMFNPWPPLDLEPRVTAGIRRSAIE